MIDDHAHGERILELIEDRIARVGGSELLDDARTEARWFADLFHPWNGRGREPLDRLTARLDILRRRYDRAVVVAV